MSGNARSPASARKTASPETPASPVDAWLQEFSKWLLLKEDRRREILAEMESHLREAVDHEIQSAESLQEAERRAVRRFGPPAQTANQLTITWRVTDARRDIHRKLIGTGVSAAVVVLLAPMWPVRAVVLATPAPLPWPWLVLIAAHLGVFPVMLHAARLPKGPPDREALRDVLRSQIKVDRALHVAIMGFLIAMGPVQATTSVLRSIELGRVAVLIAAMWIFLLIGMSAAAVFVWREHRKTRDRIAADLRVLEGRLNRPVLVYLAPTRQLRSPERRGTHPLTAMSISWPKAGRAKSTVSTEPSYVTPVV